MRCWEVRTSTHPSAPLLIEGNLTYHMIISSQIMPKKYFLNGDDVIDDITGWPQSFSLYSCLGEVDYGSKLQGQCLVNKCQYHNCLSRLYMPKKWSQWITLFEIASQWSTSQAYWMTLALISNIANYLKYNYFLDCDGIDNVTLRLWKFCDFCSRHIVGVAGDDIMFHILVRNDIRNKYVDVLFLYFIHTIGHANNRTQFNSVFMIVSHIVLSFASL